MASNTIPGDMKAPLADASSAVGLDDLLASVRVVVKPLASLKLTVALLALGIFIVFVGTLAQTDKDMWQVLDEYFYPVFAWVPLQVFFPRSFFPHMPPVPGGFWFPGGALIGGAMAVNLLAAHSVRFSIQARGNRLWAGLALIGVGAALTWLVIASADNHHGLQAEPLFSWPVLWEMMKGGLAVVGLALVAAAVLVDAGRRVERWLLGISAGALLVLTAWLYWSGPAVTLSSSSLRILWQLLQGGLAALVLLAGCVLVFKKRAGVVLLHAGIGLMMVGQMLVSWFAIEENMTIEEGQTVNFAQDIRTIELAVTNTSPQDHDDVVVVPKSILLSDKPIRDDRLPFDMKVEKFYRNSDLRKIEPGDKNPGTAGLAREAIAVEARASSGADTGGGVDLASAYVHLTSKPDGKDLGTYLLSQLMSAQDISEKVQVGGKTYNLDLRFKRTYKPYQVTLLDVRKDDYLGTDTPRNYSSDIHLVDATRNVDREKIHIWMNNPLRYAGETFYQSSYHRLPSGKEVTTLQLVTNSGWMIPYVACMIVAVGMLAHFSTTLVRFLYRLLNEHQSQIVMAAAVGDAPAAVPASRSGRKGKGGKPVAADQPAAPKRSTLDVLNLALPVAVVLMAALLLASMARPPRAKPGEMNLVALGKLPVIFQGRVKPLDTLARNTLRIISDRESFKDEDGKSQPAIRWLADVIAGSDQTEKHKIFRITDMDVLAVFNLKPRSGFRYSIEELRPKVEKFNAEVKRARALDAAAMSKYDRKLIDLDGRIRSYTLVRAAFQPLPFPEFPTEEEFNKDPEKTSQILAEIKQMLGFSARADQELAAMHPPLAVPNLSDDSNADEAWQAYSSAWTKAYIKTQVMHEPANPATLALNAIFDAYDRRETAAFNSQVEKYAALLAQKPPQQLNQEAVDFEAYFNHVSPFFNAAFLYVLAFLLVAFGWIAVPLGGFAWGRPLLRASFWLIVLIFAVHTVALVGRIYISGRPPVTNLYSSAIFIGWGAVLFSLVVEGIFRIGIGSAVAAITGFATLLIAHFLAGDGDTLIVLQAVLDTQFWLATHVTCITLGYTATFAAGVFGILYILAGVLTPALAHGEIRRALGLVVYGVLCFAILFSFVGTVLGGLWADDSWGRFWGWDPKENGALIIVLWNALVLHARWDGMVRERGTAVLAIGGNIVTAWSWFGVNELGIGLHSYGFTEGVLLSLGIFVVTQFCLIAVGMLPKRMWMSFAATEGELAPAKA